MMMMSCQNLNDLCQQHPDSWLLEYIGKCKSGEILIGHELMQELDIHLALFDDPDIRFDWTMPTSVLSS